MAPVLHVFIFIGLLFVVTNLALSRLSRRLELRERRRTGTRLRRVKGVEDQRAAACGCTRAVTLAVLRGVDLRGVSRADFAAAALVVAEHVGDRAAVEQDAAVV